MTTSTREPAKKGALFTHYFDELEPGDTFTTRARTITETDIVSFATLTGDLHPVHTDAVWAGASPFGERIAHGMLLVSYAIGLVPLSPDHVLALRRISDATFKAAARIGDTIAVEGEVASLQPLGDEIGQVSCKWRIVDQDGRTLVRTNVDVLWRREPAFAATPDEG